MSKGDIAGAKTRPRGGGQRTGSPTGGLRGGVCQALFRLKDSGQTKEVLLPWADAEDPPAEVPALSGSPARPWGNSKKP